MAKKENGPEKEEVKLLSLFEKKMKDLLDELDEHMAQVGGDYGPILMEILQILNSGIKNLPKARFKI